MAFIPCHGGKRMANRKHTSYASSTFSRPKRKTFSIRLIFFPSAHSPQSQILFVFRFTMTWNEMLQLKLWQSILYGISLPTTSHHTTHMKLCCILSFLNYDRPTCISASSSHPVPSANAFSIETVYRECVVCCLHKNLYHFPLLMLYQLAKSFFIYFLIYPRFWCFVVLCFATGPGLCFVLFRRQFGSLFHFAVWSM